MVSVIPLNPGNRPPLPVFRGVSCANIATNKSKRETVPARIQAIFLLGESSNQDAYQPLVECLFDANTHVRHAAILAIGNLLSEVVPPDTIDPLKALHAVLTKDRSPYVKQAVTKILQKGKLNAIEENDSQEPDSIQTSGNEVVEHEVKCIDEKVLEQLYENLTLCEIFSQLESSEISNAEKLVIANVLLNHEESQELAGYLFRDSYNHKLDRFTRGLATIILMGRIHKKGDETIVAHLIDQLKTEECDPVSAFVAGDIFNILNRLRDIDVDVIGILEDVMNTEGYDPVARDICMDVIGIYASTPTFGDGDKATVAFHDSKFKGLSEEIRRSLLKGPRRASFFCSAIEYILGTEIIKLDDGRLKFTQLPHKGPIFLFRDHGIEDVFHPKVFISC